MARPVARLDLFPGVTLDPRDAPGDPPAAGSSPGEDDAGEVQVSMPFVLARFSPPQRQDVFEREEEEEEEEDSEEEEDDVEEEDWSEEEEEEEDDVDSGYSSLPEEDSDEDEEGEDAAQARNVRDRPPTPFAWQRAESPSPAPSPGVEEEHRPSSPAAVLPAPSCHPAPCPPPCGPCSGRPASRWIQAPQR
ncbi:proline-, glutamic acid- and leucine-rich protein 1-like [Boleophthalmus pectinirostris]|uniref:proline-, glutamic acid- and leucine-rich protein 1-like n=1 Tax=Boleophthalmus pectinirostris TaxID=150288 RepID=UPI002432D050|nr:proline-, glutamic acid- and leucine-rich protein 1-like [Boleophthalmus pectinirostris]